tara:strand:+ start:22212 stop:22769 length:558 start_codon:yes stop_codon:yes gene_type:complete
MTVPFHQHSIEANLALLQQATEFLENLPEPLYCIVEAPAFTSFIGAHLRHVLDHYDSILSGIESGFVDYHTRERDPLTETRPDRALERIRSIQMKLQLAAEDLNPQGAPLSLRISVEDPRATIPTSAERELYFTLSHTLHHFAMIAMIARHHGHQIPDCFGVAPSTLAHRNDLSRKAAQQRQANQ